MNSLIKSLKFKTAMMHYLICLDSLISPIILKANNHLNLKIKEKQTYAGHMQFLLVSNLQWQEFVKEMGDIQHFMKF